MKINHSPIDKIHKDTRIFSSSLFSRIIECVQQDSSIGKKFKSHLKESYDKIEYFLQQYQIDCFLNPLVFPLLPNSHPLIHSTIQVFFGYAPIIYFNKLQERHIFSKIWERELNLSDFIKSEFFNLSSTEVQSKIRSIMVKAIECAFLGPFFAYLGLCILPIAFGGLINAIILSIAKSIIIYIFFQQTREPINFPMLSVAGSIRGAIFYYATVLFKSLQYNAKDVFYFSIIVRYFFEPQIKKIEKLSLNQFLTRNFSAT